MSCLCILEINPLSVASFANIFSRSEGQTVVLLKISYSMAHYAKQKLSYFVILEKFNLLRLGYACIW